MLPYKWQRIGAGLDPDVPLASGHRRLAGRASDGGLWIFESGRIARHAQPVLAPHAGLLVLALAVIAIVAAPDGTHRVVRLEPGGRGWFEAARSIDAVLPDAQPVQFDPAGSNDDDNGHVAVLGGPDDQRYRHGVLGDDVEATSLLLLERHGLQPLARLDLPAPHVFEDIAPRPITLPDRRGLVTIRSGPQGAQLAIVAADAGGRFALAALGQPLGRPQRWLSPSTDGVRVLAVHTPHLGGVVHRYRLQGPQLADEVVGHGVANHAIGQRDLDVSAWLGPMWVVPTQQRRGLRWFDLRSAEARSRDTELPAPAVALRRWQRHGQPGVAVLLQDGSVAWVAARA